jgi:hypothetical protein
MIFDVFQSEGPAACDCAKLASCSTPGFEVAALAMVSDMAGAVCSNCRSSTFAFWCYVVLVKLIGRNGLIAEVAAHIDVLLFASNMVYKEPLSA